MIGCKTKNLKSKDPASIKSCELLEGHTSRINDGFITQDLNYVITCSGSGSMGKKDNTVRIWNIPAKRQEAVLYGHTDRVVCLCLSGDPSIVFSGSVDSTVIKWNLQRREAIQKYECGYRVKSIQHPVYFNKLYVLTNPAMIIFSSISSEKLFSIDIEAHFGIAMFCVMNEYLYIENRGKLTRYIDDKISGEIIQVPGVTSNIKVSSNNELFVYGSDILAIVINMNSNKTVKFKHTCKVCFVELISNETELLSASILATRIWNIMSETCTHFIDGVGNLLYTPSDASLFLTCKKKTIYIYERSKSTYHNLFICHNAPILSALVTEDSHSIFTLSFDSTIREWDAVSLQEKSRVNLGHNLSDNFAISGNKRLIVLGSKKQVWCFLFKDFFCNQNTLTPKIIKPDPEVSELYQNPERSISVHELIMRMKI